MLEANENLDEDFKFYLSYTGALMEEINNSDKKLCQAWLKKLRDNTFTTREQMRNRNIFLSNLILCMQCNKMVEPFTKRPEEVDFNDVKEYFENPQKHDGNLNLGSCFVTKRICQQAIKIRRLAEEINQFVQQNS